MHLEKDVAAAMLNAGAVAYLTKGEAHDNLIAAIRSCTHTSKLECAQVGSATG